MTTRRWTASEKAIVCAAKATRTAKDIAGDYGVSESAIIGVWDRGGAPALDRSEHDRRSIAGRKGGQP